METKKSGIKASDIIKKTITNDPNFVGSFKSLTLQCNAIEACHTNRYERIIRYLKLSGIATGTAHRNVYVIDNNAPLTAEHVQFIWLLRESCDHVRIEFIYELILNIGSFEDQAIMTNKLIIMTE